MPGDQRLLVAVALSDHLRAELDRLLPGLGWEAAAADSPGPWPTAEALLVGDLRRDLKVWSLEATPRLRFVQTVFTGLDRFPFDRFDASIRIAGNSGGYAPFVAEHAVGLILALSHHLPENVAQIREGRLRPVRSNRYLLGGTAVILGFGAIGREIAHRLRGLGMRVDGVSRQGSPDAAADRVYPPSQLEEAVSHADVVVECRPLTSETAGTVGARLFQAMPPTALFVNVGRAATVDEEALYQHLSTHPEFRAATDVWWDEDYRDGSLRTRFPFASLPNFIGTPHVAAIGEAARRHAETRAVENLARYFLTGSPRYVADPSLYRALAGTRD